MTKPKIIQETSMPLHEVKDEVEKIRKRDTELGIRTTKVDEYLNLFVKIPTEKAEELKKKIEEVGVTRIKQSQIHKIIDIMPTTPEDVKMLFQSQTVTITNEQSKKIADIVKEYA